VVFSNCVEDLGGGTPTPTAARLHWAFARRDLRVQALEERNPRTGNSTPKHILIHRSRVRDAEAIRSFDNRKRREAMTTRRPKVEKGSGKSFARPRTCPKRSRACCSKSNIVIELRPLIAHRKKSPSIGCKVLD